MKHITITFLLFFSLNLYGQNFNTYELLTNQGELPKEFTTPSSVKYQKQIEAEIDKESKKRTKKDQKQFYLQSNFSIDKMLRSGKVLYNDPISSYISEVAQLVLKNENEIQAKDLKFYTVRSSIVNAFATNNGEVFVTLGLLAKLENEAQLAFILSHEISHVQKEHVLNFYMEAQDINRNIGKRGIFRQTSFDDALLAKSNYSKDIEIEADHVGLTRFQRSPYSLEALGNVFDVLRYANHPYANIPFEQSFLESEHLRLPEDYFLKEINPILPPEEGEEENSTHPSLEWREKAMKEHIEGKPNAGKQEYLIPKARFENIRKTARFELAHLYLHYQQYQRAIYQAFLLKQDDKNSLFLDKVIAKALYGLSKFRNDEKNKTYKVEEIQGEIQQVYNLTEKLTDKELNVLALHYIWTASQKYPNDEELSDIRKDCFEELARYHCEDKDYFSSTPSSQKGNQKKEENKDTSLEAYKKGGDDYDDKFSFAKYAFVDLLKDSSFVNAFDESLAFRKKMVKRDKYYDTKEGLRELNKYNKRIRKKGYRLGIDKVVVVDPFYLKLDLRKDNVVQYERTEKSQEEFVELLEKNGKAAGLDLQILDKHALKKDGIEEFNDITLLNDWFSEQTSFDGFLMAGTQQEAINNLAKKYGTDYFVWTGTISVRESNYKAKLMLLTSIVYPIFLPFTIYSLVKGSHDMLYFNVLYDVSSGRYSTIKFEYLKKSDSNSILNAQIGDAFHQITSQSKNKK